ncbi:MAG: HEAT repeat domain-containing protein [Candidatus Omnitrophica bacterium]|nr:HEAT repeat domain-containing protein [Candidatus Omnitrophota bacterium]
MVAPAAMFMPLTLKGLVIHPENALKFDFLMDTGNSHLQGPALTEEARKIMTYFLTALTMPEDDLWVNLSPYEHGKVIEKSFGNTLMGRDLLAADYVLKQLTASLIYPEDELGQKFWKEVYAKTGVSQSDIPIETVNKVWIVPSDAVVWENNGKVMIIRSKLKVMLEEDYVALSNQKDSAKSLSPDKDAALKNSHAPGQINASQRTTASQAVRTIVLPVLEKQVNEGEHFAQLRQMYQAMILATWYKKVLKESILSKVYADQKKIKGVDNANPEQIEGIYRQYLEAFKKGVFNYIREDVNQSTGETIPRKYFSGGFTLKTGLVALATSLSIWLAPTPAQAIEISQATKPVGETVLVQGIAGESNDKGQAIRVAQANDTSEGETTVSQSRPVDKENILELLSAGYVNAVVQIGPSIVPVLIEALKDEDWRVRQNALRGLKNIGNNQAIDGLIEALKNKYVRRDAVEALKDFSDEKVVSVLFNYIGDNYVREEVLQALQNFAASNPSLLFNGIKNENVEVRRTVGGILSRIKNNSVIPILQDALSDSDTDVRNDAKWGLEVMEASWWQKQSDTKQWVMILLAPGLGFLGLTYRFLSTYKTRIIEKLVEAKKLNSILEYLNDNKYEVQIAAQVAVEQLITEFVKTRDKGAIEQMANLLNRPLRETVDYELYNTASEALFLLGDGRGEFQYQYHAEERHQELVHYEYGSFVYDWVVDKEAYWEKVERSGRDSAQAPSKKDNGTLTSTALALGTALYLWSAVPIPAQAAGFNEATVAITQLKPAPINVQVSSVVNAGSFYQRQEVYRLLANGRTEWVVAMGPQAAPALVELLTDDIIGPRAAEAWSQMRQKGILKDNVKGMEIDGNREAVLTALRSIVNRNEIIKSLRAALVGGATNISAIRTQQLAIREALSLLGVSRGEMTTVGTKLMLLGLGLGVFGGAWFLYFYAKKRQNSHGAVIDVNSLKETADQQKPDELGGIALDPKLMNMQIRRDGDGTPLPLSQQPLDELNIQGFVPQILSIQNVNLVDFLGLNSRDHNQTLARI